MEAEASTALEGVYLEIEGESYITDNQGQVRTMINGGADSALVCAHLLGYHDSCTYFPLDGSRHALPLQAKSNILTEVEILSESFSPGKERMQNNVLRNRVEITSIPEKPLVLGEPDALKPLQALGGVNGGVIGSADLYVRGSDQFQNAFFIDQFPVFYTPHFYGYFSPFPVGGLAYLDFHKQAFPANLGNGVSSFVDMKTARASKQRITGTLGGGIGSFHGSIAAPLAEGKVGVQAAARVSNTRWLLELMNTDPVGFEDVMAKVSYEVSSDKRLEVVSYMAHDYFGSLEDENSLETNERNVYSYMTGVTFSGQPSSRVFFRQKLYWSGMSYRSFSEVERHNGSMGGDQLHYQHGFDRIGYKPEWVVTHSSKMKSEFGGDFSALSYRFPKVRAGNPYEEGIQEFRVADDPLIWNVGIYYTLQLKLSEKLRGSIGGRCEVFLLQDDERVVFSPRVHFTYEQTERLAYFVAYDRTTQDMHRLRNGIMASNQDVFVPANQALPVEVNDQLAAGVAWSNRSLGFDVQAFYRSLSNAVDRDYKKPQHAYSFNEKGPAPGNPYEALVAAEGFSYGVESSVQYKAGIFSAEGAYSWMRSRRTSPYVNKGRPYNFEYFREHNLVLQSKVRFKRNAIDKIIELGATWMYGSGYYNQFPLQFQQSPELADILDGGPLVPYIGDRNDAQLPAVHHLDIAINFMRESARGVRTFSISVFNVYAAPLITNYTYNTRAGGELRGSGPWAVIPSITYTYRWK